MDTNKIIEEAVVEQFSLPRQLTSIEQFVLNQSWLGQTYKEMAQKSGYGSEYIKEIGSQLWQELSEAFGEKVTKKNIHLVLNKDRQDRTDKQKKSDQQEFLKDADTNDDLPTAITDTEICFPSGPVPLNSPLYINRPPLEEFAFTEISQPGCVIRIKAPRNMGKSSLLNRIVAHAKAQRYKTVYINFQETDKTVFTSLDKFLRWFCANISRQLNLNPRLDDYWDEDMGSKVSCKIYFEAYLHKEIDSVIFLALDEVNRVFEHPNIAQDFLPMLRFWHEQAKQDSNWQKLRLAVVHTTEVYVLLKLNQSPFNVGLSITLPQFTLEQVQDLAQRYGLDWVTSKEGAQALATLKAMVGGHPYLVNLALYYLQRREITLEQLLQTAPTPSGIYSDHLRSHLAMLQEEPQLASAMRQVVTANESVLLEAITAYKLESMGLIQLGGNQAKPSCELYRLYFREQLRQENLIDAAREQLQPEQQKDHLAANIDQLTQLANRCYFNQYLEAKWQQGTIEALPLSLIICEIDYFKFFNDIYGYQAGNECLQLIANTILDCAEYQAAFVARYEGARFAVILPQIDAQAAVAIAENIRDSIIALAIKHEQSMFGFGGFPARVITVSLGVASTIPSQKTSPTMLTAASEEALHQAIRKGRNRISVSSTLNVGLN